MRRENETKKIVVNTNGYNILSDLVSMSLTKLWGKTRNSLWNPIETINL